MFFNDYKKIANNIYDISLIITEKLNFIISSHGYDKKLLSNKDLFCSISLFFCFNYFEIVLNNDYGFNVNQRSKVINNLIVELNYHLNSVKENLTLDAYNQIKKDLLRDDILNNKEVALPAYFLMLSLGLSTEEVENKPLLLFAIYKEFETILKNVYKIK